MLEVKGNLLDMAEEGKFDIVIHCANCWNTMNSGIAREIRIRYPEVYEADCKTIKGDRTKLGKFTYAEVKRFDFSVINLYGQYNYGRGVQQVDYDAVRSGLRRLKQVVDNITIRKPDHQVKIGTYQLGCNRAGGDWVIVKKIIEDELVGFDITIVEL